MDHKTTFGADGKQLAQLFALGKTDDKVSNNNDIEQKTNLLFDLLANPFDLDLSLTKHSKDIDHTLTILSSKSIGQYLLDSNTPLDIIEKIKGMGKDLSMTAQSKVELHVVTVVYFAAIAHAFLYHQKQITSQSKNELISSFQRLKREVWIQSDLKSLFAKAESELNSLKS